MGLHNGFKKFITETYPAAVVVGKFDNTDICIIDGMCVLHSFYPNEDGCSTGLQLIAYIWREMQRRLVMDGPEHMAVLCFDQHEFMPAPKQVEMRARDARKPTEDVVVLQPNADQVVEDMLPSPWQLVLKHRNIRARVCEYIRTKLTERFYLSDVPDNFSMVLYGAGGPPSMFHGRANPSHGKPVHIESDHLRPSIGESDISMVALRQYFHEFSKSSTVTVSTVDTDLIAILLLQTTSIIGYGKTLIDLYYHQKGGSRMSIVLDIDALRHEIQSSIRMPITDYVVAIMLQGTDFVERVTSGVGWETYMERVGHFWNDHGRRDKLCQIDAGTRTISLNRQVMHDMLHYVMNYAKSTAAQKKPAQKKQKTVTFDQYFGERALWNLTYWITAGRAAPEHHSGWITDADGRTIRREGMFGTNRSTIKLTHM